MNVASLYSSIHVCIVNSRRAGSDLKYQRLPTAYCQINVYNKSSSLSSSSSESKAYFFRWMETEPPPAAAPAPAPANPLNMLFGNQPTPAPKPAPKPAISPPPPERKGPIRMQIPMDDDDGGFDEEEGIDASSNKKMSIADAMRTSGSSGGMDQEERSKKW